MENKLTSCNKAMESLKDEREDQEVQLVQQFKDTLKKIQDEIQHEKIDRERQEEALLSLME